MGSTTCQWKSRRDGAAEVEESGRPTVRRSSDAAAMVAMQVFPALERIVESRLRLYNNIRHHSLYSLPQVSRPRSLGGPQPAHASPYTPDSLFASPLRDSTSSSESSTHQTLTSRRSRPETPERVTKSLVTRPRCPSTHILLYLSLHV